MPNSLHPSAEHGFRQTAALYQTARPSYPDQIIDWLRQELALNYQSEVVDLGAGTGKFIPYLQKITQYIQAIEPISEMLEQLKLVYPHIHCIETDSKNLKLLKQSTDAILCAQSFHWFADQESLQAIYTALKPKASLGLIWNQRDTSFPWVKAIADALLPFEGDTPRFHNGTWREVFNGSDLFEFKSVHTYPLLHTGTVEQVIMQRLLSTSFVAASSPEQKEHIYQKILNIVHEHLNKDLKDTVDFPYVTYAYHYQKR